MEDLYSIPFGTLNITLKIREYDISFFLKTLSHQKMYKHKFKILGVWFQSSIKWPQIWRLCLQDT